VVKLNLLVRAPIACGHSPELTTAKHPDGNAFLPVARFPFWSKHRSQLMLKRFMSDETGATAIEYGLIAAGISVAIIAVVQSVGSSLNTTFTSVATALK
jgi:pilus assembly protein Flp/PilA